MSEEWTVDEVNRIIVNPFYAITIDPTLSGEHEPIVSEDQWVAANAKTIEQVGSEQWLRMLLDVLKGGWV